MKHGRFVLLPILLAGCSSIGSLAGAGVGIATGGATTNPLVGYAAGIGTKAVVDELVRYVSRKRQQGEQDEIAAIVGGLQLGQTAPWEIRHTIPIGNEHGDVTVVRLIDSALTACKEVAFTVIDHTAATFVTTACRQDTQWKWAQAEPAAERWGFLQ